MELNLLLDIHRLYKMNIKIKYICNSLHEASVDMIESGTMNETDSLKFAIHLIESADSIIWNLNHKDVSEKCDEIIDNINEILK